jgi:hypothetical protein
MGGEIEAYIVYAGRIGEPWCTAGVTKGDGWA